MNAGANPKAGAKFSKKNQNKTKKKEKKKRESNVGFISLGVVLAARPGQHSKINFLFLVPHRISLFVLTQKEKKKKKSPAAHRRKDIFVEVLTFFKLVFQFCG